MRPFTHCINRTIQPLSVSFVLERKCLCNFAECDLAKCGPIKQQEGRVAFSTVVFGVLSFGQHVYTIYY